MKRHEKSMNLKILAFAAAAIAATALTVYATGFPELRNVDTGDNQVEHVPITTTIKTRDAEAEARTSEIVYIETPATPPTDARVSYNGIYEGDTITGILTYYDVCLYCCGKTDGITASGIQIHNGVEPEMPVVGCNWLPLMTVIAIDGVEYIVADRGGDSLNAVGRLDVFNPAGHEDCLQRGITYNAEIIIVDLPEVSHE